LEPNSLQRIGHCPEAFDPPPGDFDADVGFFGGEDGGVDFGLDAAGVMDGGTRDLQKAAMRRRHELPDIEDELADRAADGAHPVLEGMLLVTARPVTYL
jgi:hypothetical protein